MEKFAKEQIREALAMYCEHKGSQNKAANSLKGVSSAVISKLLNGDWDLIADEMWRNIGAQIGYSLDEWAVVSTRDFQLMTMLLQDAQKYSNVLAVVGDAGSGKSLAIREYSNSNKRVFNLCCNEYWNRKMFMQELLSAMGRDYSGYTVGEMMGEIVSKLKIMENPIIVMDEADKLSDNVLYFFISLYNKLEGHCGIMLCATDHLEKRIKRGLKLNKKGYKEIYSRIGRRFIQLQGVSSRDIAEVCMANGISDSKIIKEVVEDSEWDLRRVRRKIHAIKNL
ncbi:MAG: ATPase [Bacteroidetes bacterium HGW-Bacteroidetes-7]|jgi:hypothetical protein|nr:MAG: ATPase [Bacteroidetes bacterium HGW-Bacteroidetes-7]